jgi:hypothetical protein
LKVSLAILEQPSGSLAIAELMVLTYGSFLIEVKKVRTLTLPFPPGADGMASNMSFISYNSFSAMSI